MTRYWCLKLALQIALIAAAVVTAIFFPGTAPLIPATLPVALVVLAGLNNLYHYRLLRAGLDRAVGTDTLVTDRGLYRVLRHPMYLGDLVAGGGLALLVPWPYGAVLWMMLGFALVRQSRSEDRELASRFGDRFERWRGRTGLILPGVG